MKLYVVMSKNQVATHRSDILLEQACASRGIEYVRLVHEDIIIDDVADMHFEKGDLLYRIFANTRGLALESLIATLHADTLTTIYKPLPRAFPRAIAYSEIPVHKAADLPIIPTRLIDEHWIDMSDGDMQHRIDSIDGFPVILKYLGSSHGQGVEKIDDMQQLRARLQESDLSKYDVILRKYLADYRHFRLVVIDGEVVAPIEYFVPEDDFRTNAVEVPNVSALDASEVTPEIRDIAIKAVEARRSILGGVDILIDNTTDKPYLAEVNVPCYYPRSQDATGIDVAGRLVDALVEKAKQHD